jgi:hypothetical protein
VIDPKQKVCWLTPRILANYQFHKGPISSHCTDDCRTLDCRFNFVQFNPEQQKDLVYGFSIVSGEIEGYVHLTDEEVVDL